MKSFVARRFIPVVRLVVILSAVVIMLPLSAFCSPDMLVDSKEYGEKDFRKGCITDYKDLAKGDNIDWVWVKPGVTLADYGLAITTFENKTDDIRNSQVDDIKSVFKEILEKHKGDKGTLSARMCIYEVQKFSPGKAWIPFAGGNLMQAGLGVEMIVSNKGKAVAAFRHFAREGARLEDAAQEVASDIREYLSKH
ncbi:MAG: hypothetical protein M0T70_14220 [Geobacteraceae bacterium]|nr:hypothetical protein [Geobacteraceae bacterium]